MIHISPPHSNTSGKAQVQQPVPKSRVATDSPNTNCTDGAQCILLCFSPSCHAPSWRCDLACFLCPSPLCHRQLLLKGILQTASILRSRRRHLHVRLAAVGSKQRRLAAVVFHVLLHSGRRQLQGGGGCGRAGWGWGDMGSSGCSPATQCKASRRCGAQSAGHITALADSRGGFHFKP